VPPNAVVGFLPSVHGLHFQNRWPSNPARSIRLGPITIPIGDTGRGLCGGMAFAARARFERGEIAPPDDRPPDPGTPLFQEIVDRQFDSFGRLFVVPIRFWVASAGSQAGRDGETVRDAWPAIRAEIDAGRPSMVGLVRLAGWNPLAMGLGHQVVAFRYAESATGVEIGIYDPNHPGRDDVSITVERRDDGAIVLGQSTGEALIGLLALPWMDRRPGS
jgi:hypothetical protein